MTDGIRKTIKDLTGDTVLSCPWRAFFDPFVRRVIAAVQFAEHGNLAFAVPHPSARLIRGIAHYDQVDRRVQSVMQELEREAARRRRVEARGR